MPKWLHKKLSQQARKHGLTGDRKDAYVYGAMNKIKPQRKGGKLVRKK